MKYCCILYCIFHRMNKIFQNQKNPQDTKPDSSIKEIEETDVTTSRDLKSQVILFNDDIHTFDDVIIQIIKACGYNAEKATEIAYEADRNGKAKVYEGDFEKCLRVSNILEEIRLRTQIIC